MFDVCNTRNGRNIKASTFCNIFQNHWFEFCLITCNEEFALKIKYNLHGRQQGVVALFERINKPFCRIYFLFDKLKRFLLTFATVLCGLVCLQHTRIRTAHAQTWHIVRVQRQNQFTVLVIQIEVRENTLIERFGIRIGGTISGFRI